MADDSRSLAKGYSLGSGDRSEMDLDSYAGDLSTITGGTGLNSVTGENQDDSGVIL